LGRRKHVVAKPPAPKPAATALLLVLLWLRPLLKSAEIKKLCRGGSDQAEHQTHRDGQCNQPITLGKDTWLFWFPWHALGPHTQNLP
jgi:hypothetical protein